MSKRGPSFSQRLLRWYPARWRRFNGAVRHDALEQHSDSQGSARETPGGAWSVRAHGLAVRATPTAIVWAAGAGLLLGLAPTIVLWSGAVVDGLWATVVRVVVQFLGALLVSVAAGPLLLRAGIIRAEPAFLAVAAAVPAWFLGALTAASWSVGFTEADAGAARSWFGNATVALLMGAWAAGSAALMPVAFAVLRAVRSQPTRIVASVALSATGALALGVTAATPVGLVVGATAVLSAASFQLRGAAPARPPRRRDVSEVLTPTKRRSLAATAAAAAVVGVGCAAFALTGSSWVPTVGDATDAMRVGILAGALVGIVTVVTGALTLLPRVGRVVLGPAVALVAALVALASSYALDAHSPLGWPLILVAAALTGLAAGLLLAPILPGALWLRTMLVAAISLAAAVSFGLMIITAAAFLAPGVAIVLTIVLLRRPLLPPGRAATT